MTDADRGLVLSNLARLLFLLLPTASVLLALRDVAGGPDGYGAVGLAALYFATMFIPVAVGGVAHSLSLVRLQRYRRVSRAIGILTSPSVLIGVILLVDVDLLLDAAAPIAACVFVYGLVIRLPNGAAQGADSGDDREGPAKRTA